MIKINNIRRDFLASIVVFLVALPLCLGVALASGFSASAGIISGIIGGLIVGFFAGCPLQVSGPAAGLIIIVIETVHKFGIEAFGFILFLSGIIQLLFGLFKMGQLFRAVSPAIIQGMLSGIGISILFGQFHVMLDDTPKGNVIQNILMIPQAIQKGIFPIDGSNHHLAAAIGILTIGIIILWNYLPQKVKTFPSALVAVVVAIIVCALFGLPIKYINIPSNIAESLTILSFSSVKSIISTSFNYQMIIAAISIAFIGSAETLITATAVDKMQKDYQTNYDKEIFAQGIGNTIAGFLGVIPISGVIVRSAANIQSGGKTKLSTILHGLWLLIFLTCLPFVLSYIPTACLAGILVYTGYKLINPESAKKIFELSKGEFLIFLITVSCVVLTNLLEGILIGVAFSILKNIYKMMQLNILVSKSKTSNKITVFFNGNLTFLKLPQIKKILEDIDNGQQVSIRFERFNHIDHACIDTLIEWQVKYEETGGKVYIDWDLLKYTYPNFGWHKILCPSKIVK